MDSAIDYAIAIIVSFGAGAGVVWADARRRIRKAEHALDDLWARKNAQVDKLERLVDTLRRANHEGDKAEAALRDELKAERARNETLNLQLLDANARANTASTAITPEAMRALGDVLVDVLHGRKSDDDEDLADDAATDDGFGVVEEPEVAFDLDDFPELDVPAGMPRGLEPEEIEP